MSTEISIDAEKCPSAERNEHGQTPFLATCWHGNVEQAIELYAKNPAVVKDVVLVRNMTALHIVCHQIVKHFCEAAHIRYYRLLKYLLFCTKVDIDAQDWKGRTALHCLLQNSLPTDWLAVELDLLLQRKPNMTIKDENGKQPCSAADFYFFHKFYCEDATNQTYSRREQR
jgi:ankyrin repeat protein